MRNFQIVMNKSDRAENEEEKNLMWERSSFLMRLVASSVSISESAGRIIKVVFLFSLFNPFTLPFQKIERMLILFCEESEFEFKSKF